MRYQSISSAWTVLPLAAALLFSAGHSRAQEGVYSFTSTQPQTTGPWANRFSLPQFDPALGSLEAVRMQVTFNVTVSGSVFNAGNTLQDFGFAYACLMPVTLPQRLGSLLAQPLMQEIHYTLDPGGRASYGPYSATDTKWVEFTGAGMAPFIGTGSILFSAETFAWPCVHGGDGKVEASLTVQSDATFTVKYFDAPVPEPTSAALLPLALSFAMVAAGRRPCRNASSQRGAA
jgi:hypothetical protein